MRPGTALGAQPVNSRPPARRVSPRNVPDRRPRRPAAYGRHVDLRSSGAGNPGSLQRRERPGAERGPACSRRHHKGRGGERLLGRPSPDRPALTSAVSPPCTGTATRRGTGSGAARASPRASGSASPPSRPTSRSTPQSGSRPSPCPGGASARVRSHGDRLGMLDRRRVRVVEAGWPNRWAPRPTVLLPLAAAASGAAITQRFLAEARSNERRPRPIRPSVRRNEPKPDRVPPAVFGRPGLVTDFNSQINRARVELGSAVTVVFGPTLPRASHVRSQTLRSCPPRSKTQTVGRSDRRTERSALPTKPGRSRPDVENQSRQVSRFAILPACLPGSAEAIDIDEPGAVPGATTVAWP